MNTDKQGIDLKNMTVFFSKRMGVIYSIETGITDIKTRYGEDNLDVLETHDCIVMPYNPMLFKALFMYEIDLETRQVKLKDEYRQFL